MTDRMYCIHVHMGGRLCLDWEYIAWRWRYHLGGAEYRRLTMLLLAMHNDEEMLLPEHIYWCA